MEAKREATAIVSEREVLTVSELNREARRLLESGFGVLWVEGEISNMARPGSGHWYFSLKDSGAQVQCAMFLQRNRVLSFRPANGEQVLLRARVSLYEPRGNYQLIVDLMEPAGEGALRQAYEKLKRMLDGEGLFALAHKRTLPVLPQSIGVVTSPTGAAIRDILKVLRRRFPSVPVIVYPVPVQGEGAAERIARMLALAGQRNECDVLILARGGGSLEDLWAFNEELLARAIYASPIPVVCGVGHEVDVSIADLVADLRAPTPSAAAELVVPDRDEWQRTLDRLSRRAAAAMIRVLGARQDRYTMLVRRLRRVHPLQSIQQHGQRSDELVQRMNLAMSGLLNRYRSAFAEQLAHLRRLSPLQRVDKLAARNTLMFQRLSDTMQRKLEASKARFAVVCATLDVVSPLATLGRGYAILHRELDGSIVRRAGQVKKDELLRARLNEGTLTARVVETTEDDTA